MVLETTKTCFVLSLRSLLSCLQHSRTNHCPYLRTRPIIFSRSITFSAFFCCQTCFHCFGFGNNYPTCFVLSLRSLLSCFQHTRKNHCPYLRTSKSANSAKQQKHDNTNLSWLESWMAAKPWQNRLMEEAQTDRPEMTPFSRRREDCSYPTGSRSNSSEHSILKPKRNNNSNLPIKMYPRSPVVGRISRSSSDPSSDFLYDGSSESTSSSTNTAMEIVEENHMNKPNYMNLTESIKAKQKPSKYAPPPSSRPLMEDTQLQLQMKSMAISNGDTRSSAGSYTPSVKLCKDLYPPEQLDRMNWIKSKNCLF